MANPAAELYEIFETWREANGGSNVNRRGLAETDQAPALAQHVRAMSLLSQIDAELKKLRQRERRTGSYDRAYPNWVKAVLAIGSGNWGGATSAESDLGDTVMDPLEQLADVLDHLDQTPLSRSALENFRNLVDEVLAAEAADPDLDERLRLHIRRVVRHLQTCIEEFDVHGYSATMEAADNVWSAMQAAAFQSKDPGRWVKFKDRFVVPAVVGLVANGPGLAFQIEQFASGQQ